MSVRSTQLLFPHPSPLTDNHAAQLELLPYPQILTPRMATAKIAETLEHM